MSLRHPTSAFCAFTAPMIALATLTHADPALRAFNADRPDRTESPYSVPQGHWQLEFDAFNYVWFSAPEDPDPAVEANGEALGVLPFNLKYGVHPRVDLQLVVEPWGRSRLSGPGGFEAKDQGSGDITGRIKLNLFGNDGGRDALALLPYVSTPTRGDQRGQIGTFGVVTPFSFALKNDRSLSAMLVVAKDPDLDPWLGGSASLGSPLVGDLSGFVELYATRAGFKAGAPSDLTFDGGVTYPVGADAQVDGGVFVGLTDTSEHWRVFLGFSVRR